MTAVKPCHECGTTAGKAALAAMCNRCADEWAHAHQMVPGSRLEESAPAMRFMSAAEIKASTPVRPPYVAEPYVIAGAITLWGGKPKVGKSTVSFGLAAALVTPGAQFLGMDITHGPVVYLSEESTATLVHKLPQSDDLLVLTRDNAWPKPDWPTLISAAVVEAQRIGAIALFVDTLPFWAGLAADRENNAGAALLTMDALDQAAATGLAVVVPMHTRKGGGEDGEGLRGSGAWAGSGDVIVEMDRVPDMPRQRVLLALSRYPQTPGTMVVELGADDQWRMVSQDDDRSDPKTIAARNRTQADRDALLDALSGGSSLTRGELEEAIGAPDRQWHKLLDELLKEKKISRSGSGVRGNPYRYEKVLTDTAQTPEQKRAETTIPISAHSPKGNAEMESLSDSAQALKAETLEPLPGEPYDEWSARIEALASRDLSGVKPFTPLAGGI